MNRVRIYLKQKRGGVDCFACGNIAQRNTLSKMCSKDAAPFFPETYRYSRLSDVKKNRRPYECLSYTFQTMYFSKLYSFVKISFVQVNVNLSFATTNIAHLQIMSTENDFNGILRGGVFATHFRQCISLSYISTSKALHPSPFLFKVDPNLIHCVLFFLLKFAIYIYLFIITRTPGWRNDSGHYGSFEETCGW